MAGMLTLAALADDPERFHLIDVGDAEDYVATQVTGGIPRWPNSKTGRVKSLPARRP